MRGGSRSSSRRSWLFLGSKTPSPKSGTSAPRVEPPPTSGAPCRQRGLAEVRRNLETRVVAVLGGRPLRWPASKRFGSRGSPVLGRINAVSSEFGFREDGHERWVFFHTVSEVAYRLTFFRKVRLHKAVRRVWRCSKVPLHRADSGAGACLSLPTFGHLVPARSGKAPRQVDSWPITQASSVFTVGL